MTEAIKENIIETNDENVEIVEREKPYHFRRLKADDVPAMLRIVKKIGLKEFKALVSGDSVKHIIKKYAAKPLLEAIGMKAEEKKSEEKAEDVASDLAIAGILSAFDIVEVVLDNLMKVENDVFAFLARVSDLDEQGVRDLDMVDFMEMLIDFFRKEEFPDFFKVVSKLFN